MKHLFARSSGHNYSVAGILAVVATSLIIVAVAIADAPDPVGPVGVPLSTASIELVGAGPEVRVTINGGWYWGTHTTDCNTDRAGIGYSVAWFDPSDAGNALGASASIAGVSTPMFVGSLGTGGRNAADNVAHPVAGPTSATVPHDVTAPASYTNWRGGCGKFTGSPARSNGAWGNIYPGSVFTTSSISHVFAKRADVTKVCVVTYDVHGTDSVPGTAGTDGSGSLGGKPSGVKEITAGGSNHNGDNDVQKNVGAPFEAACTFFPVITTVATGSTFAANATTANISDVATVSGAKPNQAGSVVFDAYGPQSGTPYDCSSANRVGGATVALSGANVNHTYSSGNIGVAKAGDYVFTAKIVDGSGNTIGLPSGCNDDVSHETAHVDKATPSLSTNAGTTVRLKRDSSGAIIPTDLTDTATLSGATLGAAGPITFSLYSDAGCSAKVGSDQTAPLTVVAGTKNHNYTGTVAVSANGTYHWIANLPADDQNAATSNACNDTANGSSENVLVIDPKIDVEKKPVNQSVAYDGTAHFTIKVTNIGDSRLTDVVTTDVQAPGCVRDAAATAALMLGSTGPGHAYLDPTESFTYTCDLAHVIKEFTNVVGACGKDILSGSVCDNDNNGGDPPPGSDCAKAGGTENDRCAGVGIESLASVQDFAPNDGGTVTVTAPGAAPDGYLRFKLYKGDCKDANLIYDSGDIKVDANGKASTSNADYLSELLKNAGLSTDTEGHYNWQLTYSGDKSGNPDIVGACGVEDFDIDNG